MEKNDLYIVDDKFVLQPTKKKLNHSIKTSPSTIEIIKQEYPDDLLDLPNSSNSCLLFEVGSQPVDNILPTCKSSFNPYYVNNRRLFIDETKQACTVKPVHFTYSHKSNLQNLLPVPCDKTIEIVSTNKLFAKKKEIQVPKFNGVINKNAAYLTNRFKSKCKRLLSVGNFDKITKIPPDMFKAQLLDTSDLIFQPPELPSTKFLVQLAETPLSKVMETPFHSTPYKQLAKKFARNCVMKSEPDIIDVNELGLFPIGYEVPIDKSKIKRITRRRKNKQNTAIEQSNNQNIIQHNVEYILPNETYNEIISNSKEMIIDEDGNECYILAAEMETANDEYEQILVIKGEDSVSQAKNNLEVLLAAAEEGSTNQIYLCQNNDQLKFEPEIINYLL